MTNILPRANTSLVAHDSDEETHHTRMHQTSLSSVKRVGDTNVRSAVSPGKRINVLISWTQLPHTIAPLECGAITQQKYNELQQTILI